MYAESSLWIDAPSREVFAAITDPATWPQWLPGVEATDVATALDQPGCAAPGSIRLIGRTLDVEWRVASRVRDTIRLHAVADGQVVAVVRFSCSAWNGGCATEFSIDSDGGRARSEIMGFRLHRSIRRLARLVETRRIEGRVPSDRVGSHRGSRSTLHRRSDVELRSSRA